MRSFRRFTQALFATSLVLLAVTYCAAQAPAGTIEGSVSDSAGARIANATVRVMNKTTARKWDITTDENGIFKLANAPLGVYRIEISHSGFAPKAIEDVIVEAGTAPNLIAQLTPENVSEQVDIAADTQLLQPETSTITGTINARTLTALPTASRNFTHLIVTQPGYCWRIRQRSRKPSKKRYLTAY